MKDDRGEVLRFTIKEVLLTDPGSGQTRRVPLKGRTYTFENIPAGVKYRVLPSNFRADPPQRFVTSRPNREHRQRDFHITGPHHTSEAGAPAACAAGAPLYSSAKDTG
jgi:hypothetical protein